VDGLGGIKTLTFDIPMEDTIIFKDLKDLGAKRFLSFSVFSVASPPQVVVFRGDPVEKDIHAAVTSVDTISVPWN
jgi:hypothetical protein